MAELQNKQQNPLSQFFRQPKVYFKLPSAGKFWRQGTLDVSESNEYAVYAMTAKDELMFKTPDALLSGQSTVEVLKSCIPAFLDPWEMPTIDLDAALMAIRIATYGENMGVTSACPECNTENDYDINLSNWLGKIGTFEYISTVDCEPLTIHVRPYTYRELTKTSMRTFEEQRIIQVLNDDKIPDQEKVDAFGKSFVKITEMTVDIIATCISSIDSPNGSTDDRKFILEFINNAPKEQFEIIQKHITNMKEGLELRPQDVSCHECGAEFIMPVTLDQSNFFAVRS
jgi:hypothetical protein